MINVEQLLSKYFGSGELDSCVVSAPINKDQIIKSITIRPIKKNNKEVKAEFKYTKHNDIKTISTTELMDFILNEQKCFFKQILLKTNEMEYQILSNKKGKSKIIQKPISKKAKSHNKEKKYLIPDNTPCDFLIEIGVMDKNGKVKSHQYKKFRQINRFLEMVYDLYKNNSAQSLHIVDFGCGKSYLTFALYYFFTKILVKEVEITGIDLKQEVINHCNQIAQKLAYTNLKFVHGFIHDFKTDKPIDFVVTLHACDTATDDAILFSLKHEVDKMMFVPCCQHELNSQLENSTNQVMLKYGIFKDRLTSIITDSMRAQLLEISGYKVQTMEFIDMEHTAKNILLRCQKTKRTAQEIATKKQAYQKFKEHWSIAPYLEKELANL